MDSAVSLCFRDGDFRFWAVVTAVLPIRSVLPELKSTLASNSSAVLCAPPGSGKTTVVPLELLDQPWLAGRKILLLEPRRLAARAAAARMAWRCGESVGDSVGYRIRLDSCVSKATRIEVMTEGVLTRRIQQEPELPGVGLILFDEFHERSLQADLALALALDVAAALREDLRLLVMSATLDSERVSALLGNAAVIRGEGTSHPVEIRYLNVEPGPDIVRVATAGILRALAEQQGDLLVFLPGSGEIGKVTDALESNLGGDILLCPLFGELTKEQQERAIQMDPSGRRRIVLATSIAETSLTIEGISTVVDSGWSRLPSFNPNSGLTRLETVRVSKSSADQRSGRAGRLGPGVCYRLWTRSIDASLEEHTKPEILDADLASLMLELAQWGVSDPAELKWLDAPAAGSVAQARELLGQLEALNQHGRITRHGEKMVKLPIHPRLAHMLLKAGSRQQAALAADLAALVSERDIFQRRAGRKSIAIEDRLELLARWRSGERAEVAAAGGNASACTRVVAVSRQLSTAVTPPDLTPTAVSAAGVLLSFAYPDRIAQRRKGGSERYLLASGRGVKLPAGEPLAVQEYLVVAEMDAGRIEGKAHLAASIDIAQLRTAHSGRIVRSNLVAWEPNSCSVIAREEERLGAIVLGSRPMQSPDPASIRQAMLFGIREAGVEALPWSPAATAWRARIQSLRCWQPDVAWPDFSDTWLMGNLEEWLLPWLDGISRQQQLKRLDLEVIMRSRLDWSQQQQMERLAPTHISVPSGSRRSLSYLPGEAPVLKVRLQEMFGLEETPRVCNGDIPIMLHLLSPAQRPVQITQDLRGFWDRTYDEIRKELKGRYPKHYWPEDPRNAVAISHVRPNKNCL